MSQIARDCCRRLQENFLLLSLNLEVQGIYPVCFCYNMALTTIQIVTSQPFKILCIQEPITKGYITETLFSDNILNEDLKANFLKIIRWEDKKMDKNGRGKREKITNLSFFLFFFSPILSSFSSARFISRNPKSQRARAERTKNKIKKNNK